MELELAIVKKQLKHPKLFIHIITMAPENGFQLFIF